MEIDQELSEMVESGQTGCSNPWRQEQSRELGKLLLETLRSPDVAAMEYGGEHRVNPGSAWTRPVRHIVRTDGRRMKLAFTGLSNVQAFSGRGRSTHCYPEEFGRRLERFMGRSARGPGPQASKTPEERRAWTARAQR